MGSWSCFCKTRGIDSFRRLWSVVFDDEDNWAGSRLSLIIRLMKRSPCVTWRSLMWERNHSFTCRECVSSNVIWNSYRCLRWLVAAHREQRWYCDSSVCRRTVCRPWPRWTSLVSRQNDSVPVNTSSSNGIAPIEKSRKDEDFVESVAKLVSLNIERSRSPRDDWDIRVNLRQSKHWRSNHPRCYCSG